MGIVLAVILVAGTVLAWRVGGHECLRRARRRSSRARRRVRAVDDDGGTVAVLPRSRSASRAGRYIGVMAALTLPALAVAADAITRRWSRSLPFVCLVFLVPGTVQRRPVR